MGSKKGKVSRLFTGAMAIILGLSAFGSVVAATPQPIPMSVQLLTDKTTLEPGDEVTVSVRLTDLEDTDTAGLTGADIGIAYDKSVFSTDEYVANEDGARVYQAPHFLVGSAVADDSLYDVSAPVDELNPNDPTLPEGVGQIHVGFEAISPSQPLPTTLGQKDIISFKLRVRGDVSTDSASLQVNANGTSIWAYNFGDPISVSPYQINYGVASFTVQTPPDVPSVLGLTALQDSYTLDKWGTANATVEADLEGGSTEDVSAKATWGSSDESVATVSSAGVITAISKGTATIDATYEDYTAYIAVTVNNVTVTGVTIDQPSWVMLNSETKQLHAQAMLSNYSTIDVTADATWASDDTDVVTVVDGNLEAIGPGKALVSADFEGSHAELIVTVANQYPEDYEIWFDRTSFNVQAGDSVDIRAALVVTGLAPEDVTLTSQWTTDNDNIAMVSGGTVTGVAEGHAKITATFGSTTASLNITVSGDPQNGGGSGGTDPQPVTLLDVTVNNPTVNLDLRDVPSYQLSLTAEFSDTSTLVVTDDEDTTWVSDNTNVAKVVNGLVTAVGVGKTTLHATYQDAQPVHISVTVTNNTPVPPHETDLVLVADKSSITVGEIATVTPKAVLSNSTTATLPAGNVTWSSSNTHVATVTNGIVTAVAPGTVTISGTYSHFYNTVRFTVTPVTPSSVYITPSDLTVAENSTITATANARYSDSTTEKLTSGVTWTSENPAVATVSTAGVITGKLAGATTITATYNGITSAAVTVTVTSIASTVTSLTVTPATVNLVAGGTQTLTAVATYNDHTTAVVGPLATYTSNATGVVTVSSTGVLTAVSAGNAVVTVGFANQTATVNVTVTAAPVVVVPIIPTATPTPAPTPTATPSAVPTATPTTTPSAATVFDVASVKTSEVVNTVKALVETVKSSTAPVKAADTTGHWAESTIDTFVQLGVVSGYSDGTIRPNTDITRAEFVTILSKLFNVHGTQSTAFVDTGDHWAKAAIEQFAAAGVISGYGAGEFKPNRVISREEMVVIVSRLVNLQAINKDSTKGEFTDLQKAYAADAIKQAAQAGLIEGKGKNNFDPKAEVTRAEAFTVIMNMLKLNPDVKTVLESVQHN